MIRSSLSRHQPRSPADQEQLTSMAQGAWRGEVGLWIPKREIERMPELERMWIQGIGNRLYGETRRKAG